MGGVLVVATQTDQREMGPHRASCVNAIERKRLAQDEASLLHHPGTQEASPLHLPGTQEPACCITQVPRQPARCITQSQLGGGVAGLISNFGENNWVCSSQFFSLLSRANKSTGFPLAMMLKVTPDQGAVLASPMPCLKTRPSVWTRMIPECTALLPAASA
ncbi:Rho-related GTP-binding protein RhoH [Galemys pyrenaicus]|uniref:Rho-related GTP-binding protein RhoH n=1 Tax=Galemys pyrenaicus TaxID=202257 RepID=A0A8J6DNZ3_GALPY|nr:Rho-related GTP-binding protein RhoH [Galemys pyrenaicus]